MSVKRPEPSGKFAVWYHLCPVHGEELCFAERFSKEQVHTCRVIPERHFWKGESYMKQTSKLSERETKKN